MSEHSFFKANPDLKNERAFQRFKDGRKARFEAKLNALQTGSKGHLKPPLYSHDQTWQSQFERGWRSVSKVDLSKFEKRYYIKQAQSNKELHPRIQKIVERNRTGASDANTI